MDFAVRKKVEFAVNKEKMSKFLARGKKSSFAAFDKEKTSHVWLVVFSSNCYKIHFFPATENPVMCMTEKKSGFYSSC